MWNYLIYTFHLKYSQSSFVLQRSLQACHVVVGLSMETTKFFGTKVSTLQFAGVVSVGQNFFPDSNFELTVHNISDREHHVVLTFQLKYEHLSFALQRSLHSSQVENALVLKMLSLFGYFPSPSSHFCTVFVQYFSPDTKSESEVQSILIDEHSSIFWPWLWN